MRQLVLLIAFTFVVPAGWASAQEPPYVNSLPAEPPYYRVRYEGSKEAGELVFPSGVAVKWWGKERNMIP